MANSIDTAREIAAAQTEETQHKEMSSAEICFGALMGIAAIAGLWGAVSLMITYCMG